MKERGDAEEGARNEGDTEAWEDVWGWGWGWGKAKEERKGKRKNRREKKRWGMVKE